MQVQKLRPSVFQLRLPVSLALAFASIALLSHCTFKKNQPDVPYASESRIEKSFFYETDSRGRAILKTFIAGWAPEMSAGGGGLFVGYNSILNVQRIPVAARPTCMSRTTSAAIRWPAPT